MMLMAVADGPAPHFSRARSLVAGGNVLTGIRRDSPARNGGGLRYFLLGAFSSAFFLYGIAFTYGLTGSTHLARSGQLFTAQALRDHTDAAAGDRSGGAVGFAFKVSAVPFHMWTPDAYEGAPPAGDEVQQIDWASRPPALQRRLRARCSSRRFAPSGSRVGYRFLGHRGGDIDPR